LDNSESNGDNMLYVQSCSTQKSVGWFDEFLRLAHMDVSLILTKWFTFLDIRS